MSGYPGIPVDYDGSLKRGLEIVQEQGRQALERDEAQIEATEQFARAQWAAQFATAEARAVDRMRALTPKYAERAEAAKRAIRALAEFCSIESSLGNTLDEIGAELNPVWMRLDPIEQPERWAVLRQRAGLSESHRDFPLFPVTQPERIAATALRAIVGKVVRAGAVIIGGKAVTYNFEG